MTNSEQKAKLIGKWFGTLYPFQKDFIAYHVSFALCGHFDEKRPILRLAKVLQAPTDESVDTVAAAIQSAIESVPIEENAGALSSVTMNFDIEALKSQLGGYDSKAVLRNSLKAWKSAAKEWESAYEILLEL